MTKLKPGTVYFNLDEPTGTWRSLISALSKTNELPGIRKKSISQRQSCTQRIRASNFLPFYQGM